MKNNTVKVFSTFRVFTLDRESNLFYIHSGYFGGNGCVDYMKVITAVYEWAGHHTLLLGGISAVSLIMVIGTVVMLPFVVARIPDDYFLRSAKRSSRRRQTSPSRLLYLVVKNLVGVVFIIAGIIMLFIPGQGIVTILIGIMLMNFPRKRRLALRFVRQPSVLKAVNWMRARSQRSPLILPRTDSVKPEP